METWSSRFALLGMLSTLAGCESILFSLTSAAAVTCAIMKPLLSPELGDRNGGSPLDRLGLTSCSIRRSEIFAISAIAMAK